MESNETRHSPRQGSVKKIEINDSNQPISQNLINANPTPKTFAKKQTLKAQKDLTNINSDESRGNPVLNSNRQVEKSPTLKKENEYLKKYNEAQVKIEALNNKINELEEDLKKNKERIENEITLKENLVTEKENMRSEYSKIIEEKTKEINDKTKNLSIISQNNKQLMSTLDELRKQVDEQFEKVNFKQVATAANLKKKVEQVKEPNPLEIAMKVKEKELKNSLSLIEILKKDNEALSKNLESYSDYKSILETLDKLKLKEKENQDLQIEIRTLNKTVEDHKKCNQNRSQFEVEMRNLKDDLKKTQEKLKEYMTKFKDEELRHNKTRETYLLVKKDLDVLKSSVTNRPGINNEAKFNKALELNHDGNINSLLKSVEVKNRNASSMEKINEKKKIKIVNQDNSVVNTSITKVKEEKLTLFTQEDRAKLEKVLSEDELDKLERKFESIVGSRASLENKNKSDLKIINKKLTEQEEQNQYLSIQYKESEQRSKILQFQINEYKNEQKIYQRKLNEVQGYNENFLKVIKEKDQENNILINQLNSVKKLVKHNAVPPMDVELAKHLEKIKNESYYSERNPDSQDQENNQDEEEFTDPNEPPNNQLNMGNEETYINENENEIEESEN